MVLLGFGVSGFGGSGDLVSRLIMGKPGIFIWLMGVNI